MARNAATRNNAQGWVLYGSIAILSAFLDLITKRILFQKLGMPGESPAIVVLHNILLFETNLNEGALFGIGQGMGLIFAAVSAAAIIGILVVMSRPMTRQDSWLVLALGLVTGGIIGNLYDRLGIHGLRWHAPLQRMGQPVLAVRDWIHFKLDGIIDWPIFNLADTWLVIGAGLLVLVSFRVPKQDPSHDSSSHT